MLDNIKGEVKVFTREVEVGGKKRVFFNVNVGSTKVEDGEYINYYMLTEFSQELKAQLKETEAYKKESFDLLIESAWIKAYKDKNGYAQPKLFVNKGKIVAEDKKPAKKTTKKQTADDGLPF